jgi:hypothetical protein
LGFLLPPKTNYPPFRFISLKCCVAHHPAAKLFAIVAKPLTGAMSKAGSKKEDTSAPANNTTALPVPFAVTKEVLSADELEEEC